MKSIRHFLLTRLLGGASVVLATAGVIVYVMVTRSLEAQFDANLTNRVQGFASILFQDKDVLTFEFSGELMPEYETQEPLSYFELRFADGEPIEVSESLEELEEQGELHLPAPATEEPAHWTAPLPDGREGRYVSQILEVHHVYPEEGPGRPQAARVQVVIARGREDLLASERALLLSCCLVSGLLMALIAALSWFAVERGLGPTRRLAAALDAIRVQQLPERLELGELPLELQPMAETVDALIRRVDTALQRERRTTADIAHELRTPISELLTVAEVALRSPGDERGTRYALSTTRDVSSRMGRAVSTLLKLARLEMGAETFELGEVDLSAVVAEQLRPLMGTARERGLDVHNLVAEGEAVEADRDVLGIVVSNLLANAHTYAPRGARIDCRLEREEGAWCFSVANSAPELEGRDLEKLSEPFWRKDGARGDPDRSGLGLALSRTLAQQTGMCLEFELEEGWFRAALSTGTWRAGGRELRTEQSGTRLRRGPRSA